MPLPLNFKEIAETVDITTVAQHNGIRLKNNRARCPACKSSDDRSLEIIPESNSYRCWASGKSLSGDCISLHAHLNNHSGMYKAAKELHEQFCGGVTTPATTPQKEKAGTNRLNNSSKEIFDPIAFAEKLEYTNEIEALGITEEQAEAFGLGVHRGKVHLALRYASGTIAGFAWVVGGKLTLPKNLLPDSSKVVPFQRRA